jgi:two-component SAPR family response regulator
MPGDSGPKLAADVRKILPDLRVLFISGYTADELEANGIPNPGDKLLGKPFSREQIGRRIREILSEAPGAIPWGS